MGETTQARCASRWLWAAAIAVIVVINVLLLGTQGGQCTDYTSAAGVESTCTLGPAIGLPAMWFVGAVSLIAVAYCGYRFVRKS